MLAEGGESSTPDIAVEKVTSQLSQTSISCSLLDEQQSSPTTPHLLSADYLADYNSDNTSVCSTSSSVKSEERRKRRETWRREHENQLKVDGTFPRRHSTGNLLLGINLGGGVVSRSGDTLTEKDRKAVSERVIQHLGTKSTAAKHTLPPMVSDDVRVRSNLLRTLGIQKDGGANVLGSPMMTSGKGGRGRGGHRRIQSAGGEALLGGSELNTATSRSLLSNVRLKEELKYDSDEDAAVPEPNSYHRYFGGRDSKVVDAKQQSQSQTQQQQQDVHTTIIPRRRRLLFSNNVNVVPIPMRSEYSNRIKERMYSGRVELSENAQRNVVEFEAEGWDATTVLDDENQFYKCPLTGELIHRKSKFFFRFHHKMHKNLQPNSPLFI